MSNCHTEHVKISNQTELVQSACIIGCFSGFCYFTIVMFGLCEGVLGPIRWMYGLLSATPLAITVYLLLIIGGPIISALSSLILESECSGRSRFYRGLGLVAGGLVLFNGLFALFHIPQFEQQRRLPPVAHADRSAFAWVLGFDAVSPTE